MSIFSYFITYTSLKGTRNCVEFFTKFSLKSDSEFTFPSKFHRKLGQNLKRLEPCVS